VQALARNWRARRCPGTASNARRRRTHRRPAERGPAIGRRSRRAQARRQRWSPIWQGRRAASGSDADEL